MLHARGPEKHRARHMSIDRRCKNSDAPARIDDHVSRNRPRNRLRPLQAFDLPARPVALMDPSRSPGPHDNGFSYALHDGRRHPVGYRTRFDKLPAHERAVNSRHGRAIDPPGYQHVPLEACPDDCWNLYHPFDRRPHDHRPLDGAIDVGEADFLIALHRSATAAPAS
jgi:hypothetical protein